MDLVKSEKFLRKTTLWTWISCQNEMMQNNSVFMFCWSDHYWDEGAGLGGTVWWWGRGSRVFNASRNHIQENLTYRNAQQHTCERFQEKQITRNGRVVWFPLRSYFKCYINHDFIILITRTDLKRYVKVDMVKKIGLMGSLDRTIVKERKIMKLCIMTCTIN